MILRSFLPLVTKRHVERRIVSGVTARQLFEVVVDVDAYQSFLPYCRRSQVLRGDNRRRHDKDSDDGTFVATLTVGIPPVLVETYTSHVVFHRPRDAPTTTLDTQPHPVYTVTTRSVESHYLESLWSRWKLQDVPSSTTNAGTSRTPQTASTTTAESNDGRNPSTDSSRHSSRADVSDATATVPDEEDEASSSSSSSSASSSCRVEFEVEMRVRDPIIAGALDQLLPKVAVQQVDAFVSRSKAKSTRRRRP